MGIKEPDAFVNAPGSFIFILVIMLFIKLDDIL